MPVASYPNLDAYLRYEKIFAVVLNMVIRYTVKYTYKHKYLYINMFYIYKTGIIIIIRYGYSSVFAA